jgi:hypothetical protein
MNHSLLIEITPGLKDAAVAEKATDSFAEDKAVPSYRLLLSASIGRSSEAAPRPWVSMKSSAIYIPSLIQ